MGEKTKIEWTDYTFNPWMGCMKVSQGCAHCYAEALAGRFKLAEWGPTGVRRRTSEANWRAPLVWNRAAAAAGVRRRVFCASMADVFEEHPAVAAWRANLWSLIEVTPALDWLLLTKRPQNVMGMIPAMWRHGLPENIWLGASIEDEESKEERIPHLLRIPANVRFLSCEPLLGGFSMGLNHTLVLSSTRLANYDPLTGAGQQTSGYVAQTNPNFVNGPRIHWVIWGGESGPNARPLPPLAERMMLASIEGARLSEGIRPHAAVFVKQMGSVWAKEHGGDRKGGDPALWPPALRVREFPYMR